MSQIEVRGHPSAAELAAVVVALASLSSASAAPQPTPTLSGGWVDRSRAVRTPLRPGPAAWRLAARTR